MGANNFQTQKKEEYKAPINPKKVKRKGKSKSISTPMFCIILVLALTVVLDFILPPIVEQRYVVEKEQTALQTMLIHTKQGENIELPMELAYRIQNESEIKLYSSRVFTRMYKIGLEDWPYVLYIRKTNQSIIFFVSILLSGICIFGLLKWSAFKKYLPKV